MKKPPQITRRDFLNGVALSAVAGSTLSPMQLMAGVGGEYYPPGLTGLRGNHQGSFEAAHSVAWAGAKFPRPKHQTDKTYDLVIAGGGISGLSAALMAQQRAGRELSILVLDNHDDFGGHAKRNEFDVDGKKVIGYGGSQTIQEPGKYSAASKQLLRDVAIDTNRFYDYFDQSYFKSRQLGSGIYFSAEKYGKDTLVPDLFGSLDQKAELTDLDGVIGRIPIAPESRLALQRLLQEEKDYLSDLNAQQKHQYLLATSYTDYLHQRVGVASEVTNIFRDWARGIWGVGWEACSALEANRWGLPGFAGLGLDSVRGKDNWADFSEPYIFHFPDGNAGVARSLVRKLNPGAVPGRTMEDLVHARVDYGRLDTANSPVRIRLNSTAVNIAHTPDQKYVDVTYSRQGQIERVRGRHVIYAGYHNLLPHIMPELPAEQTAAIQSVTKVPLVYINIALRNWKSFAGLGIHEVRVAQPELMHSFGMDFPVSMGGYQYTSNPDQPVVVHGTYVPALPDSGLSAFEQHKAGRRQLYEMTYSDFEEKIFRQMNGALGGGGFEAERDVAAVTVNRWPHGYAYEYNEYWDDPSFGPDKGPHITARKQVGRISIGNSDASGYAYVDGAIDAADRAVNEQFKQ
jgi:spermidine dehydrogenase